MTHAGVADRPHRAGLRRSGDDSSRQFVRAGFKVPPANEEEGISVEKKVRYETALAWMKKMYLDNMERMKVLTKAIAEYAVRPREAVAVLNRYEKNKLGSVDPDDAAWEKARRMEVNSVHRHNLLQEDAVIKRVHRAQHRVPTRQPPQRAQHAL